MGVSYLFSVRSRPSRCAPLCAPAQHPHLPSVGCTVWRAIPRAPVLQRHRPVTKVTPLTSVLIVDDEEPIRELLSRWVQSLDLQPCTAANAEEAVEAVNTRHCDLAIIDVMMPGKNGLWLVDELRRTHPDIAVVLATGNEAMVGNAPRPIA